MKSVGNFIRNKVSRLLDQKEHPNIETPRISRLLTLVGNPGPRPLERPVNFLLIPSGNSTFLLIKGALSALKRFWQLKALSI